MDAFKRTTDRESLTAAVVADAVYDVVRCIPPGRVATYGQVADLVEEYHVNARAVGQMMAFCPEDVPWHRVVGSGGVLPIARRDPALAREQRRRLEAEGVAFGPDERIRMTDFQLVTDEWPRSGLFENVETRGKEDQR